MTERAGWEPIAARRADNAERRFIMSGAAIAIVDARGAFDDGLAAVQLLDNAAEANAAALLVLVSRKDVERIDEMLAAGATHYLASPFGEAELAQALRFAERYTSRLGRTLRTPPENALSHALSWRHVLADEKISVSTALGELLGLKNLTPDLGSFLKALGDSGQSAAHAALARLRDDGKPTAFAHRTPGEETGRLVHHISVTDNVVHARVEQPDRMTQAKALAHRDALTGLGDGYMARQWIAAQTEAAGAIDPALALILISIQRFDMINASYGQGAGDDVLRGMARRIEKLVGPTPGRKRLIARLAGAEFAIGLTSPTSLDEAEVLARQLCDAIEQPFVTGNQTVQIKAHCGIVLGHNKDSDAGTILRRASTALAEAREKDGGAICVHGDEQRSAAARANRLEIDLRPALDNDEIEILFQPQVSTANGRVIGVEALSRWHHPAFGELGAAALFAAADRADYLSELSAHVQRKAVELAARWPDALGELRLAVNVTASDIADPNFVERFSAMADESGFPRDRLTAEVTESGLIADLGAAGERLAELRSGGFRVAIDDFGTGYSSLAYLKSLPLDYLKIDRRLSQDITGDVRDRVVVRGVIEMARSLGLSVIAEGVETEDQLDMLAEQGCSLYQGFLCSPPISTDALSRLVSETSGTDQAS
ncbi:MAG: bifunctional diguanylate cyclase/phosphodiesterase [Sphingomonadaceae bacterium]|nr:bifunctional diguanylate cyclase/phosphodiesterase [Sphingomonadaceae bacterium]